MPTEKYIYNVLRKYMFVISNLQKQNQPTGDTISIKLEKTPAWTMAPRAKTFLLQTTSSKLLPSN